MKLFQRKRSKRPALPEMEAIDHSLADAAIHDAVHAHLEAQAQATEARQVVAELRQVNLRNGFAPAIRKSFDRELGGVT